MKKDTALTKLENIEKTFKTSSYLNLSQCCWERFKVSEDLTEERKFITCVSWLCFIDIANENKNFFSNPPIDKDELDNLVENTWQFLAEIIQPEHCKEVIKPLIQQLNHLCDKFLEYLKSKKKKQYLDLESLKKLTFDEKVELFSGLPYVAGIKNMNIDIMVKYSVEYEVIIKTSKWLALKLKEELKNKEEYFKVNPELLFDRIYIIFDMFYKKHGVIESNDLEKHYPDQKHAIEEILKEVSISKYSLNTDDPSITKKYEEFKDVLKKKNTVLLGDNPFYDKPVYHIDVNGKEQYICPSPFIFLSQIPHLFYQFINQKVIGKKYGDVIGKVYEQYIKKLLSFYNLNPIECENKVKDGNSEQRADFLLETSKYLFIIECKNSVGLHTPFYHQYADNESHPLLSTWNRISKSLEQCSFSLQQQRKEKKNNKESFSLVVVNELILADAYVFMNYYCKFFKGKKFKQGEFNIISRPHFEYLVASSSLEGFAEDCKTEAEKHLNFQFNCFFEPDTNKEIDLSFWDTLCCPN